MTRKNRECITFCFGFSETCAAQKRLKTLRNPPGKGRTLRHPSIRVPPQSRRRPGELAVAQLVEHPAVVRAVGGSSPSFQTFLVYHFAACCEKVAAGEWGRGNGSRLPRIRYLAGSRGRPFFLALAALARKEFGRRRRWRARGAAGGWEHGLCVLCAADTLAVALRQVETSPAAFAPRRPNFWAIWVALAHAQFGAASHARGAPGGCGVGSECVLGADDALCFCPEL